ncbi:hypothetical protein D9V30_05430 [Mycetocola reblochoni]|nr:hypothetical protein D9V30_05430 [Mycetocola reblochoni]
MMRQFLSGQGGIDPSQLAGAAGLPSDPAALQALFAQLQSAMNRGGDDGIDWSVSRRQAAAIASNGQDAITPADREAHSRAIELAQLWLGEATAFADGGQPTELLTRAAWTEETMPVWTQLSEPVATSIADALTRVMAEQTPEEMQEMVRGASGMIRNLGGALFAMQLGQVVGQLSAEVVSGGDVGIPLLEAGRSALVPQNIAAFGDELDIPDDQIRLYLAVRELAHSRLFRHAKWLRLDLISAITEYARGIRIDTERLETLAQDFDPSNPEDLRAALSDGSLIPPKSDEQLAVLARLEATLALIEGWVDVVTAEATARLPKADAIAETVRRRRATGGPAESAFSTLVGLELRPRRLREAAEMWRRVGSAVGAAAREALWSHPDLVPQGSDIDDPSSLVARLEAEARGESPEPDDIDQGLAALLDGTLSAGPRENASDGSVDDPGSDDTDGDDRPGR